MTIRIALLGCGTVGTQVAKLLLTKGSDYAHRVGDSIELVGIAVRDTSIPRDPAIDPALLTDDADELMSNADVVIELIGGIEPARTLVLDAIRHGASIVTGNKALLASHGPEIFDAAEAADVDVYYEAAVAGAVPVVYAIRESLAGDKIHQILGIVNGTTNYILDEMETNGLSFDEALAQAQELGYAEADPTADVDGHDAAAKAAILASLAFHTRVSIDDVPTRGIRDITLDQIQAAKKDGYAIKLIATANVLPTGIDVRVEPTLLPVAHPLATIHGSFNAVVVEAEAADRLMFYGRGAGGAPTASAVMGDVVAAAAHHVVGGQAPRELAYAGLGLVAPEDSESKFRIVLHVKDRTGVLSWIAGVFAHQHVSIQSVSQTDLTEESVTLAVTTHRSTAGSIDTALTELKNSDDVLEIVNVMRVEEA